MHHKYLWILGGIVVAILCLVAVVVQFGEPPVASLPTKNVQKASPDDARPFEVIDFDRKLGATETWELENLATNPDFEFALMSGWERVRRTMPKKESPIGVTVDQSAIERFLGLVEGRVLVPLPEFWKAGMKSAACRERSYIRFYPDVLYESAKASGTTASVMHAGDQHVVSFGDKTLRLPEECSFDSSVYQASVQFDSTKAYVALYGGTGYRFGLSAVDLRTGKIVWSSMVRGVVSFVAGNGTGGKNYVELRLADEKVVVFGVGYDAAYVEEFDQTTGKKLRQFCTGTVGFPYRNGSDPFP